MPSETDRRQFLNMAALFEGGLAFFALALGWLVGINPTRDLFWEWTAVGWGVGAAIPIFVLFLISHRFPVGGMTRIQRFLIEQLGPPLAACRWYDLLLLAGLAGLGEELLFRGVLQPVFERWGPTTGLVVSNILFGLAHLITPLYAVIAGLIGVYLGVLLDVTEQRNLLTPIVTHAVYDLLAFWVIRQTYLNEQHRLESEASEGGGEDGASGGSGVTASPPDAEDDW